MVYIIFELQISMQRGLNLIYFNKSKGTSVSLRSLISPALNIVILSKHGLMKSVSLFTYYKKWKLKKCRKFAPFLNHYTIARLNKMMLKQSAVIQGVLLWYLHYTKVNLNLLATYLFKVRSCFGYRSIISIRLWYWLYWLLLVELGRSSWSSGVPEAAGTAEVVADVGANCPWSPHHPTAAPQSVPADSRPPRFPRAVSGRTGSGLQMTCGDRAADPA
jgi:hypothetical protein